MCMTKKAEDISVKRDYREDILREFLERNRAEARAMSIYEYDEKEHIRLEREAAFEEGARSKLRDMIDKKLAKNKTIEVIAEELEEDENTIRTIIEELDR